MTVSKTSPTAPAKPKINPFAPPPGPYGTTEKSWASLEYLGYAPTVVDVRTNTKADTSTPAEYTASKVRHNGLCLVSVSDVELFSELLKDPAWNCAPIFATADPVTGAVWGTFVFKSFGNHDRTIGEFKVHSVAAIMPGFEGLEKFVSFPPSEDGLCQWIQPPAVHKGWLSTVPLALATELAGITSAEAG